MVALDLGGEVDGDGEITAALTEGVVFRETLADGEGLFAQFLADAIEDGAVDEEAARTNYADFEDVEIAGPVK